MLGLRWFDKHARWERDIDAYVDAELPTAQRAVFEAHMEGCKACAAQVGEATALKRMLSEELTEHPVPRSFRLTPAMVAAAAPSKKPASAPWWPRAAQAVGGLAVAAFAFFLVVDLSATSDDAISAQSLAGDDAAFLESSAPETDSSDGSASDTGVSEAPSLASPSAVADEAGVAGAADVEQGTAKIEETPDNQSAETSGRSAGEPGSGVPVGGLESAGRPDDSGMDRLLFAQIASIAIALAAAATYLASRRMRQE